MRTKFWSKNLKGKDHVDDLGLGANIMLEWIFGKGGWKLFITCLWLRVGTSG
jgi:hypothetical protein